MPIDFSKLNPTISQQVLIDPSELFGSLPRQDARHSYLRNVQGEVLQQWFARRGESDLAVKMNTGSGKTAVGLLILWSSLQEGVGPALYLTPDNYLAEQVAAEARALGISVTNDPQSVEYRSSNSICVANVYKLFNGKSVFGLAGASSRIPIGSIVIDDAHACVKSARAQFSLRVPRSDAAYDSLLAMVLPSLEWQRRAEAEQLKDGDPTIDMLVPPWTWSDLQSRVIPLLTPLRDSEWMRFCWPLVKETLQFCRVAVSSKEILIVPPCLPVEAIPSFRNARRRIYLTATLADDSGLIKDLAADAASLKMPISPLNASDLGDRMILSPFEAIPGLLHEDFRAMLRKMSSTVNVVVIVPSRFLANRWADVAQGEIHDTDSLNEAINRLRNGHVGVVVLVNRYDGIDLPDDACRILVIDGLPAGTTALERLEMAYLDGTDDLLRRQLERVEQGMGRGIRSNDDYCVILLSDPRLATAVWSYGLQHFSAATAAQLSLSRSLATQLEKSMSIGEFEGVIRQCLDRDPHWITASRKALAAVKYPKEGQISGHAVAERRAFDRASNGNVQEAVIELQSAIAGTADVHLRGWLKQEAAGYQTHYDPAAAQALQGSAKADNRYLLRPTNSQVSRRILKSDLSQADAASQFCSGRYESFAHFDLGVRAIVEELLPDPNNTPAFEKNLALLGSHLGFETQLPEKEAGKGPDVLWALGSQRFLVIECKSGATTDSLGKQDLGQLGHSHDWFRETYGSSCVGTPVMVHPSRTCAKDAVAASGTEILTFEKLAMLRTAVVAWSTAVCSIGSWQPTGLNDRLIAHQLHAGAFPSQWTLAPRRN